MPKIATKLTKAKIKKPTKNKKEKKEKRLTESDRRFLDQVSTFEKEQKKLSKMVGSKAGEEFESSQSAVSILRASLAMYIDILPKAEKVFLKFRNERSSYALVSLTNTMRDILKDLTALSNVSNLGDRVSTEAVDPAILQLAQTHIAGLKGIRREIYKKHGEDKEGRRLVSKIDKIIDAETNHITEVREQVTEQIANIMRI